MPQVLVLGPPPGGDAEIDQRRLAGLGVHQDVGRIDVLVDDLPLVQAGQHLAERDREPEEAGEVHAAGGDERLEAGPPQVVQHQRRRARVSHQVEDAGHALQPKAADEIVLPLERLGAAFVLAHQLQDDGGAVGVPGAAIHDAPAAAMHLLGDRVPGQQRTSVPGGSELHRTAQPGGGVWIVGGRKGAAAPFPSLGAGAPDG
jgi:hypothetical protein